MKPPTFECVYEPGFQCPYIDTSGPCQLIECPDCEHYHNGVRATGGMPTLAYIVKQIKRLLKTT